MKEVRQLEYFFQTLGDANRLRIIQFIGKGERSVSEIVEALRQSQPLVSHHLRILREKNILETRREGPFIYYSVKDKRLLDALGIFQEIAMAVEQKKAGFPMFGCPAWWKNC